MREIRKSGSEGGVRFNPAFLPLSFGSLVAGFFRPCRVWLGSRGASCPSLVERSDCLTVGLSDCRTVSRRGRVMGAKEPRYLGGFLILCACWFSFEISMGIILI